MRIEHFRFLFKNELDVFYINENIMLFKKPFSIWNKETDEEATFKSVDEMLEYKIGNETVKEMILKLDKPYMPELGMPKSDSGGKRANKKFKFSHANDRKSGRSDPDILPAVANTKIKSKSLEGALTEFKRNHLFAKREFSYAVDEDGYVTGYKKGQAHSVEIPNQGKLGKGRRSMIIHNHPSGGAFSDADLLNTASDRRTKGIIASGKNYDYKFEKTNRFNAQAFTKAVQKATMSGTDYDDAVNKWLRRNQAKFGYKYSRTKN